MVQSVSVSTPMKLPRPPALKSAVLPLTVQPVSYSGNKEGPAALL